MRHAFRVFLGVPGQPDVPLCGARLEQGWRASPSAPACPDCTAEARRLLELRKPG